MEISIDKLDIIGLTLDKARYKLEKAGINILNIRVTSPPREKTSEYDDGFRVLLMNTINSQNVELLVCKPLW